MIKSTGIHCLWPHNLGQLQAKWDGKIHLYIVLSTVWCSQTNTMLTPFHKTEWVLIWVNFDPIQETEPEVGSVCSTTAILLLSMLWEHNFIAIINTHHCRLDYDCSASKIDYYKSCSDKSWSENVQFKCMELSNSSSRITIKCRISSIPEG